MGARLVSVTISLEDYQESVGDQFFDLVVGNPPYSRIKSHVEIAKRIGKAVIFLTRQGFMASQSRARFFRDDPPSHVFMMPNRPSFEIPASYLETYPEEEFGRWGGDSADYAWVCWQAQRNGPTELHWLPAMDASTRRAM